MALAISQVAVAAATAESDLLLIIRLDRDDDDAVDNDQQVDAIVIKDSSQKAFWWEWEC